MNENDYVNPLLFLLYIYRVSEREREYRDPDAREKQDKDFPGNYLTSFVLKPSHECW